MKAIKQYAWTNRGYAFDAKCEFCGIVRKNLTGYSNDHYKNKSIPNIKCTSCGKCTNDLEVSHVQNFVG